MSTLWAAKWLSGGKVLVTKPDDLIQHLTHTYWITGQITPGKCHLHTTSLLSHTHVRTTHTTHTHTVKTFLLERGKCKPTA